MDALQQYQSQLAISIKLILQGGPVSEHSFQSISNLSSFCHLASWSTRLSAALHKEIVNLSYLFCTLLTRLIKICVQKYENNTTADRRKRKLAYIQPGFGYA